MNIIINYLCKHWMISKRNRIIICLSGLSLLLVLSLLLNIIIYIKNHVLNSDTIINGNSIDLISVIISTLAFILSAISLFAKYIINRPKLNMMLESIGDEIRITLRNNGMSPVLFELCDVGEKIIDGIDIKNSITEKFRDIECKKRCEYRFNDYYLKVGDILNLYSSSYSTQEALECAWTVIKNLQITIRYRHIMDHDLTYSFSNQYFTLWNVLASKICNENNCDSCDKNCLKINLECIPNDKKGNKISYKVVEKRTLQVFANQ